MPNDLLDRITYRLSELGTLTVEQAGVAHQIFTVTEAFVTVALEDPFGNRTSELEIRAWFTDTDKTLVGFDGILDKATLFLDMRQTNSGWIELDG